MNKKLIILLYFISGSLWAQEAYEFEVNRVFYQVYKVNAKAEGIALSMHWKNSEDRLIGSLEAIKEEMPDREVLFSTNGGIYSSTYAPEGLYIENQKILVPLNSKKGKGNFYMQPNAVFCWDTNKNPSIITTAKWDNFNANTTIDYAVQSGPLLLKDRVVNPQFRPKSTSKYIRNGVGVDANGNTFFVCSKAPVNFYTFASFFKNNLNCIAALYLDGAISNMYINNRQLRKSPSTYVSMIAVSKKKQKKEGGLKVKQYVVKDIQQLTIEDRSHFSNHGLFWDVREKYASHLKLISTLYTRNQKTKTPKAVVSQFQNKSWEILTEEEWRKTEKKHYLSAIEVGLFLYNQQEIISQKTVFTPIKKAIIIGIKASESTWLTVLELNATNEPMTLNTIITTLKGLQFQEAFLCSYNEWSEMTIPKSHPNWDSEINKDIKKLLIIQ